MPGLLVGDDPMPASSGLGASPTDGPVTRRDADSVAKVNRESEAGMFFSRPRDAKDRARLDGERGTESWRSGSLSLPTPTLVVDTVADDAATPTELIAAWRRECERARVVDAYNRREVIAREITESNRARSRSAQRRQDVAREEEARRRADRERVARWQMKHPDRARATKQRWVENNLEKRRQASRDYYHRHKEDILAKARERHLADPSVRQNRQAKYRQTHPDQTAALSAAWRSKPENRERHKEATRRWEQRERRRREVGLPPRRIHRRTPAEKLTDARNANEFFERDWSHTRIRSEPQQRLEPTPPALLDSWEADSARARLRHRLQNDLEFRERIVRRRAALQDRIQTQERRAAAQARVDAVARAVNDRLRVAGARRRPEQVDPAAPHQLPAAPTGSGLGR